MVAEEGFRNNAQMGAAACVALLCCATAATLPAREATPAGLQVRWAGGGFGFIAVCSRQSMFISLFAFVSLFISLLIVLFILLHY